MKFILPELGDHFAFGDFLSFLDRQSDQQARYLKCQLDTFRGQQLGQLKRVESESTRGRSVVTAVIQDQFNKNRIPQVWDELRRKIDDVQSQLPPSVRGKSLVVDDFGDVYGVFLAITGKGFTQPSLLHRLEGCLLIFLGAFGCVHWILLLYRRR